MRTQWLASAWNTSGEELTEVVRAENGKDAVHLIAARFVEVYGAEADQFHVEVVQDVGLEPTTDESIAGSGTTPHDDRAERLFAHVKNELLKKAEELDLHVFDDLRLAVDVHEHANGVLEHYHGIDYSFVDKTDPDWEEVVDGTCCTGASEDPETP